MSKRILLFAIACNLMILPGIQAAGKNDPDIKKGPDTDQSKTHITKDDRYSNIDDKDMRLFSIENREETGYRNRIRLSIDHVEQIERQTANLIRSLKKQSNRDRSIEQIGVVLIEQTALIKSHIQQMEQSLTADEKKQVQTQLNILITTEKVIQKSIEHIIKILEVKPIDRNTFSGDLDILQKNLNKLNRQFRAIDWILSSE